MPYEEWESPFQDVYEGIPGTGYLDDTESNYAEALYETGFMHDSDWYEANGYSEDDIQAIREEFFDFMGIDAADFDWEGWREAMGYE
jgi:hypothetical protein